MAATPVEFSPMSKSRLAGVAPGLSDLMTEVERRALASGIRLQVSEGMRDANRQAGLVAAGKSQTLNSKHLTGNAVDVNIVNPDGSVNWDFEAYRPVAEIAKQVAAERGLPNFVWGGDWKTLKDGVHFQLGGASQPPQTEVAAMAGGNGVPSLLGGGAQDQLAPEPKKGLLGFLSNPDARARLAIALEGMTLNPNEAFMQSMQQGIQTRGETKAATEAKNKTAAWLRSQGREDLAAAVEGGIVSGSDAFAAMQPGEPVKGVQVGNNLVHPITGQLIYTAPPEVKPGFRIATPSEANAYGAASGQFGPDGRFYAEQSEQVVPMTASQRAMWGIPATDTRPYAMGKNGMPEAIGGGGTTINVGGGENEFDKKLAEGQATMFNTMAADSVNAQADLGQIDVIEGLMASGAGGTADAWKMWAQNNLGIQIAGGAAEALDAAINKLIPSQRPPGSGTMSDRDVQLFKDSLPKLINTPEGNQIIVGTMRAMAEYKRKQGEIAAAVITGSMDRKDAIAELQRIPDPLGVVKSYIKKGATPAATPGGATPAPALAAPATPAATGPAQISSDAEYNSLPSGSEFVGPDGIKRRKP